MADRTYTTKTRAKRIALEYFKRPHPFRRAKFLLSIAFPLVAAVVLAGFAIRGDHRLYNSGPVSAAHTMFGARCGECHAAAVPVSAAAAPVGAGAAPVGAGAAPVGAGAAPVGAGAAPVAAGVTSRAAFRLPVSDQTCSVCHEGPPHHDSQAFTPACSSCHFEHKGRERLVDLGDRQCTQCHDALVTSKGRTPDFATKVTGFQSGHPQFSATLTWPKTADRKNKTEQRVSLDAAGLTDPTETCLNHETHFKPGRVPRDETWQKRAGVIDTPTGPGLGCTFCHEPDGQQAYMAPVNYAKHCADCHPLKFDDGKFPGATAPHDTPEVVRAFLRKKYTESPGGERPARAEAKAPADKAADEEGGGRSSRRLGRRDDDAKEEAPKGFSSFKDAEAALFFRNKSKRDTCLYCHSLAVPGAPATRARCGETEQKQTEAIEKVRAGLKDGDRLPDVVPTNMQTRWLPHSRFSHRAHRPLACAACHDRALASTTNAEVLVPKIATCRECHRDAGGARAACVECHVYHHDKNGKRDLAGPLTLKGFAHGERQPAAKGPR